MHLLRTFALQGYEDHRDNDLCTQMGAAPGSVTVEVAMTSGRSEHVPICPAGDVHWAYRRLIHATVRLVLASGAMPAGVQLLWLEEPLTGDIVPSLLAAPDAMRIVTAVCQQSAERIFCVWERCIAERIFSAWADLFMCPIPLCDSSNDDNDVLPMATAIDPDSDSDPESVDSIPLALQATDQDRLELANTLETMRLLVEIDTVPQSCKDLLVPVMRAASTACQNGSFAWVQSHPGSYVRAPPTSCQYGSQA